MAAEAASTRQAERTMRRMMYLPKVCCFAAKEKRFHAACPVPRTAKTRRREPAGLLRQMTG
jgi:hypothetical protein